MFRRFLLFVWILLGTGACRPQPAEPAGCESIIEKPLAGESHTYQRDMANRLRRVLIRSGSGNADCRYDYQDRRITIEVTYPNLTGFRRVYDVTLNEQGYAQTAQVRFINRLADGTKENKPWASYTFAYDGEGRLTAQQVAVFTYPAGAAPKTEIYRQDIRYTAGNPVWIVLSRTADSPQEGAVISNRYGSERNPLGIPLLLEADLNGLGNSFLWDDLLQPLLGPPAVNRLTVSKVTHSRGADSTRFVYQSDATGQLRTVTRQPGAPNVFDVKPFTYAFESNCP